MEKHTEEFLNNVEKTELQSFADNQNMFNAVMKVLLAGVYYNGTLVKGKKPVPSQNFALSTAKIANVDGKVTDEELGRNLRASSVGIGLIEDGFEELEKYKTETKREVNKISGR